MESNAPTTQDALWRAQFSGLVQAVNAGTLSELPGAHPIKRWLNKQWKLGVGGRLKPERRAQLEALGLTFGAGDVPHADPVGPGAVERARRTWTHHLDVAEGKVRSLLSAHAVSIWVKAQRDALKKGALEPWQVEALEASSLSLRDPGSQPASLVRFSKYLPGVKATADLAGGFDLATADGRWTPAQLRFFTMVRAAHSKGQLAPLQIERMKTLGFRWSAVEATWHGNLALFLRLKAEAEPPEDGSTPLLPTRLVSWLSRQRQLRSAGRLSVEQVDLLDRAGIRWMSTPSYQHPTTAAKRAERRQVEIEGLVEALEGFYEAVGTLTPPGYSDAFTKECRAMTRLRTLRAAGQLSTVHIARLDSIGLRWLPPRNCAPSEGRQPPA